MCFRFIEDVTGCRSFTVSSLTWYRQISQTRELVVRTGGRLPQHLPHLTSAWVQEDPRKSLSVTDSRSLTAVVPVSYPSSTLLRLILRPFLRPLPTHDLQSTLSSFTPVLARRVRCLSHSSYSYCSLQDLLRQTTSLHTVGPISPNLHLPSTSPSTW